MKGSPGKLPVAATALQEGLGERACRQDGRGFRRWKLSLDDTEIKKVKRK